MSKKRKITIYALSVLVVLLLGLGTFFGIKIYSKNKKETHTKKDVPISTSFF